MPEPEADDRDGLAIRQPGVIVGQKAPGCRPNAERSKVAAVHEDDLCHQRLVAAADRELSPRRLYGYACRPCEVVAEIDERGERDRGARRRVNGVYVARVGNLRGRAQQQPIDHAEHHGVRPDAEGEGSNRAEGERRRATQLPRCDFQIGANDVEPVERVEASITMPRSHEQRGAPGIEIAEPTHCLRPRGIRCPAAVDERVGALLNVKRDLVVDLLRLRRSPTPQHREQPAHVGGRHTYEVAGVARIESMVAA